MAQPSVLRHYLRLSQMTMGVPHHAGRQPGHLHDEVQPAGQRASGASPEMSDLHPLQDDETAQGILADHLRARADALRDLRHGRIHLPAGGRLAGDLRQCLHHPRLPRDRGEGEQRDEIISTAFSHPIDCAAPAVAGFRVITLMPGPNGYPGARCAEGGGFGADRRADDDQSGRHRHLQPACRGVHPHRA